MIMKTQVEEELDSEREFWYDPAASDLYYVLNTTAGPPSTSHGSFELAELKTLFELKGTQESPVTNVVFSVWKRAVFDSHFLMKRDRLPRQARDKRKKFGH